MSFSQLGLVVLLVYVATMLVVAEVARRSRRDESPGDHFLAGRSLGLFVLFLTVYATAYSGNSLLGYPGRAYRSGFSFIMATGFMMAIVVLFHGIAPRLRPLATRHGYITPGDFVRHRFAGERLSGALVIAVGALMATALGNFLLAQLKAMGEVTGQVTDGLVPYEAGVVGLALLVLLYETRGGMRAVAWTDAAQGILMLLGLAALLGWLMAAAGGLEAVTLAVAARRPEAVLVPDARTCAEWFSTIALIGLASVVYPQAIQRIYAAESGRTLARSFALMTWMPLATTLVVSLIGIAAIARLDLALDADSDAVMPVLLGHWAASGGGGRLGAVLVFVGALAAIMSTADSCLLSLGSLLSRDLLGQRGVDAAATRSGKLLAAIVLLAMVPLALLPDVTLWRLIELKMELLVQCVPAFLLALHWRRLTAAGAFAGLLAGTVCAVALTWLGVTRLWGLHAGVVGVVLNLLLAVGVSLATKRPIGAPPR